MPGIFNFCFEVFDLNDKGTICEHDIFQLIQQVQNESEKNQVDEQKRIDDLPIDYTVNHIPVTSNSLFIDAFAYDISLIFSNMVTKINPKKTNPLELNISQSASPTKIQKEEIMTKKVKKKEIKSEMSRIFDGMLEHFKNNLFEAQNANNPNMELEETHKKYLNTMSVFSHKYPIYKQVENKKTEN